MKHYESKESAFTSISEELKVKKRKLKCNLHFIGYL